MCALCNNINWCQVKKKKKKKKKKKIKAAYVREVATTKEERWAGWRRNSASLAD